MNTGNIIITILTSSLISSALVSAVNWYIQRNNYKNEYYKKLLDKRIEAYEIVIFYIDQMKTIVDLGNGKVCHRFLASGQEHYSSFLASVSLGTDKAFWLSPNISHLVTSFNIFLLGNISNEIASSEKKDEKLKILGIKHKQKISEMRIELENELQKDLRDLHNIEKFTKDISTERKYLIQSLRHPH